MSLVAILLALGPRAMARVSMARRRRARVRALRTPARAQAQRRHAPAGRDRGDALAVAPAGADRGGRAVLARRRLASAAGLVVNVVVLYCLMGFRRFSHALSAIVEALSGRTTCPRRGARWRHGAAARSTMDLASGDVARSPSSAGWSMPIARCSRVCSGSSCCRGRPAPCSIAQRRCWRTSGGDPCPASTPIAARAIAQRIRRAGARAPDCARLDSGAPDRAVVRDRRRFRGRRVCWRTQATRWAAQEAA